MQAFAEKYASELSYGTLRLLELACMLALEPKLLLLDEPASGISQKETEALGPLLRRIKEETGATILMIEHDMPLIMGLADWIYVPRRRRRPQRGDAGRGAARPAGDRGLPRDADGAREGQPRRARSVEGTDAAPRRCSRSRVSTSIYDKVQVLYDVDFEVREGERVALLGTNGAGKSTILKAVSGLVEPDDRERSAGRARTSPTMPAEKRVRLGHRPGARRPRPVPDAHRRREPAHGRLPLHERRARSKREAERVMEYFPWIARAADAARRARCPAASSSSSRPARALMLRPSC